MAYRRNTSRSAAERQTVVHSRPMPIDTDFLPNPCDAGFYVRYVEICRRAGVEPTPPERVRELVGKWNRMLRGEPVEGRPSSLSR